MNAKGEITVAKIIQKIVSTELSTPVSCKVDAQYDQDEDFYKCDILLYSVILFCKNNNCVPKCNEVCFGFYRENETVLFKTNDSNKKHIKE